MISETSACKQIELKTQLKSIYGMKIKCYDVGTKERVKKRKEK